MAAYSILRHHNLNHHYDYYRTISKIISGILTMVYSTVNHSYDSKASSETKGQSVGSGEKAGRKFSLRAKEPLGTDSHRTISKNSSGCRLLIGHKKCFVLLCPIGEHISMSSFRVFVHDGYGLDHGLSSVLLGYAPKKCTQSGNFQFDIKSPSDPTRLLCQMQANFSEPYQSS